MSSTFSYTTAFMLDRAHFGECYDQSRVKDSSLKPYYKAIALFVFGIVLLMTTDSNHYISFFVVALGVLEATSTYYHRTWWLWRQMLSKASNSEINLVIDQEGITTKSFHVNNQIIWAAVSRIDKTDQGVLLHHTKGKSYISDSCLSDQAIEFITSHHH